jgi:hypothetical protein
MLSAGNAASSGEDEPGTGSNHKHRASSLAAFYSHVRRVDRPEGPVYFRTASFPFDPAE